jgi:ABC-type spermidine/putrescine transport system permease subunit II
MPSLPAPPVAARGAGAARVLLRADRVPVPLPILLLLIFSFNDSLIPSLPLSGFTFHRYGEFIRDGELRGTLETPALVAALSSLGAVFL